MFTFPVYRRMDLGSVVFVAFTVNVVTCVKKKAKR